jgi:hypothetical protein
LFIIWNRFNLFKTYFFLWLFGTLFILFFKFMHFRNKNFKQILEILFQRDVLFLNEIFCHICIISILSYLSQHLFFRLTVILKIFTSTLFYYSHYRMWLNYKNFSFLISLLAFLKLHHLDFPFLRGIPLNSNAYLNLSHDDILGHHSCLQVNDKPF